MENKTIKQVESRQSRKRHRDPSTWKRAREKIARYSSKGLPQYPRCGHKGKPYQAFQCCLLTMHDIERFHRNFYDVKKKDVQDAFILKHCEAHTPRRHKYEPNQKPRSVSLKYFIYSVSNERKTPVCRKAFIEILSISKHRILSVTKRFKNTGKMPKDHRGGDRVSHLKNAHRQKISEFIESLKCNEPHYCRSASNIRVYLDPELSIKKLWRMYNDSVDPSFKVRESFFRHHFNTKYNIGFGTPATDVCSTCLNFRECIKRANGREKFQKMTELHVHKLRAKCFFEILKDKRPNVATFSYDCQKNMPLPKIPDQATYYSRQLYIYNFTIVEGNSNCKLTTNNVFSYTWSELDRPKGSCEIASAVYHRLKNTRFSAEVDTVRLVADGCGGQNKNSIIIMMCHKWLAHNAPKHIKTVELVFPVTGHSYLPPDRVFAQIEKRVRKKTSIIQPHEYFDIFSQHSTVIKISSFQDIVNWKIDLKERFKSLQSWHFQISKCSRIIISKNFDSKGCNILVRGEPFYKSDIGKSLSVLKKGKTLTNVGSKVLKSGVKVKQTKLQDVNTLLRKHYGEEWQKLPELAFYKNAVNTHNSTAEDNVLEDDPICEHREMDEEIRV